MLEETPRRIILSKPVNIFVEEETDVIGAEIFLEQFEQPSIQKRCVDEIHDISVQAK